MGLCQEMRVGGPKMLARREVLKSDFFFVSCHPAGDALFRVVGQLFTEGMVRSNVGILCLGLGVNIRG